MPTPSLRPITIHDFTPGIADDPGFKYQPGQAQRTNTYRCMSNPSGALVGGPRQTHTFAGKPFETATPATQYIIDGIYVTGTVIDPSQAPGSVQEFKEVFVGTEYAINVAAGVGDKKISVDRIQLYEPSNLYQNIIASTFAGVADYGSQWGMTFAESRSNRASPTTVGIPCIYMAWSRALTTGSFVIEFPDDQNATSATPYHVLDNTQVAGVYSHQNRAVLALLTNYNHGPNTIWNTSENLRWTAPNDATNANLSIIQQFFPERSDGYNDISSMSANELFLLKQSGAVVVSGDLNNPLVSNLPMTAGGGQFPVKGTRTRDGYIFLSTTMGGWLWHHGDGSTHLTPYLRPDFWIPDSGVATFTAGPIASCYSEGKYAYLPNNWMYNSDTKAWWRLDDPSVYSSRWNSGHLSSVFCAQTYYTNVDATHGSTFMYEYDTTQTAASFSWQSQPLIETVDRYTEVREIVIRASGVGTIAVTVQSENSTSTLTRTFTVSSTDPHIYRDNFAVHGDNLTVRLVSTGTAGTPVAPAIYEFSMLVHDTQPPPTTGT